MQRERQRQELRDKYAAEYALEVNHGRPSLSATAQSLPVRDGSEPIEDRLQRLGAERDARHEQQAKEAAEEEYATQPFKPQLNRTTRQMTANYSRAEPDIVSRLSKWAEEKEKRILEEKNKLARLDEEAGTYSYKPEINTRTERIVSATRSNDIPVEERLMAVGLEMEERRRRTAEAEKAQLEAEAQAMASSPRKARRGSGAAAGDFDGASDGEANVVERLMAYSMRKQERQRKLEADATSRAAWQEERSRREFRSRSPYREPMNPLMEEALQHGELVRSRRQQQYAQLLKDQEKTHPRGMSRRSQKLVAQMDSSHEERLFGLTSKDDKRRAARQRLEQTSEYTFKPELTSKTPKGEKTSGRSRFESDESFARRFERLSRRDEEIKKRIEEMAKAKEDEELAKCTFQPQLSSRALNTFESGESTKVGDYLHRTANWEKRREERLAELRKEQESAEMQKCTFQPVVHASPTKGGASKTPAKQRPRTASDGLSTVKGFDSFQERQRRAQEEKERVEEVLASGKKWKRKTTVPKEFKFQNRVSVSSVKKIQPRRLRSWRTFDESDVNSPFYASTISHTNGDASRSAGGADAPVAQVLDFTEDTPRQQQSSTSASSARSSTLEDSAVPEDMEEKVRQYIQLKQELNEQ